MLAAVYVVSHASQVLIALAAMYILPYNWDINTAMAFGAILSATDPVAVVALFKSPRAPERGGTTQLLVGGCGARRQGSRKSRTCTHLFGNFAPP